MQTSSHPPTNLLQPSRPTTATHSTDTATFGSPSLLPGSSLSPPPASTSPPARTAPLSNVLPTFSKYAPLRGTVRVRVGEATFWCHREVLALASPFFQAVLAGGWRETEVKRGPSARKETSAATASDDDPGEALFGLPDEPHRPPSLAASLASDTSPSMSASCTSASVVTDSDDDEDDADDFVECRLRICEENASSFQDLLCHVYPRLDCLISWTNVEDLYRMSAKFDIPSLTSACLAFLLPSAAGRPILCMKIGEENNIPELYKEGSRYVLDNFGNWQPEELAILSPTTLLKLERRRSWFLERLLKLGQVQILREYACHSACDDPSRCARLVAEKWGSAFSATFRFGTPQPSIIYRSLRSLEPSLSSPALHLPFTSCQNHAKLWVADLFDRMFQQLILPARNWASLTLNGLPASASASVGKYFLCIEMGDGAGQAAERKKEHRLSSI
ncbi:hypothetical protein JCM10213_002131 [Rhodosporidiobolus nylandii]